ncbi:unnamed protein product [Caenorhabditis angaria]|uniref:Uncharacterized protein n=1 Tax=Caenorhabditis angaria TaxID=860376 RepID=A0A9P1N884_9PELO|nr:unnamed protein product [Caenorhabditis angaria]
MTTTNSTTISSQRARLHAKVFYGQIFFTTCTFILGARALFTRHIPFFAWLPALLLLFDSVLAFASLLYLDFNRQNTTSFLRLILSLIVFRFGCSIILIAELFLPHSDPSVSIPLSVLAVIHSIFNLSSSIQIYHLTNIQPSEEISIKMQNCANSSSTNTLMTDVEF